MYCCDKFDKKVKDEQFEVLFKLWAVNGCCSGGCYVVIEMKFCPYCGKELKC